MSYAPVLIAYAIIFTLSATLAWLVISQFVFITLPASIGVAALSVVFVRVIDLFAGALFG